MTARGSESEKRKRVQIQNTLEEKKLQQQLNIYTKEQRYVDKELQRILQAKKSLAETLDQLNETVPRRFTRRRSSAGEELSRSQESTLAKHEDKRSKSAENILREADCARLPCCDSDAKKSVRIEEGRLAGRLKPNEAKGPRTPIKSARFLDIPTNTQLYSPFHSPQLSPKHDAGFPRIQNAPLVRTASGGLIAHSFSSSPGRVSSTVRVGATGRPTRISVAQSTFSRLPPDASPLPHSPPSGRAAAQRACSKSAGNYTPRSPEQKQYTFNYSNADMLDAYNLKSKFRQIGSVLLASRLVRCTLGREKVLATREMRKNAGKRNGP